MIVFLVAILSGMLSVLTPCVLPLLPAILASSASEGRRRPAGIIIGIVTSFTLTLLAFSTVVDALDIPVNSLRWAAAALLIVFGLVLLVPRLNHLFDLAMQPLARRGGRSAGGTKREGFFGGLLAGSGLGIVWAPCVGPILGGVAVASSTSTSGLEHVLQAVAFGAGMSIPLTAIVFGGQRVSLALGAKVNPRKIQLVAGAIFLVTGLMVAAGADTRVNRFLSEVTGVSSTLSAGLERSVLGNDGKRSGSDVVGSDLDDLGEAPDIKGITQWINTPGEKALTADDLDGKVVLVDFWTYSCINCLRTLPYIKSWHAKYADEGLVIVGVHSPEFEFEKDEANVRRAIRDLGIKYPVAMDNDFVTWRAFANQYWPAKYLIDRNGRLRYTHFGEGDYGITENAIRSLLAIDPLDKMPQESAHNLAQTPETYVGYERAEHFVGQPFGGSPGEFAENELARYSQAIDSLGRSQWTLIGEWKVEDERAIAGKDAQIIMHYAAADVHLVLGSTTGEAGEATVIDAAPNGKNRTFTIDQQKLYTLRSSDKSQDALITVTVPSGVAAYAYTFG